MRYYLIVILLPIFALMALTACNSSTKEAPLAHCGGIGGDICPNQMYCELGSECGGIDQDGVCMPRPIECPTEDSAVCGCDAKTYASRCYANTLGITVTHDGPCKSR